MSIIATAAASSLIYAMRDDDEEETYSEKYVESLTSELIEGFNPAEYVPIARDVASLFKGYEIERTDMALVGNLLEQVEMITSSKRSVPDKIFGVTGAVSAFFGEPVTNVYRDVKIVVRAGERVLLEKKKQKVAPGEMESMELKTEVLAALAADTIGEITVELEKMEG